MNNNDDFYDVVGTAAFFYIFSFIVVGIYRGIKWFIDESIKLIKL